MKNLRKYAILLTFPLHLGYLALLLFGPRMDYFYSIVALALLLIDFALSCWQMELFTSQRNKVGVLMHDFLPYLLQKLAVIGVEWLILLINGSGDVLRAELVLLVGVCLTTAGALLSGLVTFVTGAGRTMLYHDKRGK